MLTRPLVLVTVSTVLVVTVVGVTHRRTVGRDWAAMRAQLDDLAEIRAQVSHDRDALYGPTTDGVAWHHYAEALEELRGIDDWRARSLAAVEAAGEGRWAECAALLDEAEPIFAHLRRGAHACDATPPTDWERRWGRQSLRLAEIRAISVLCDLRALRRLSEGADGEAVDAWMDAQQLAGDLYGLPTMVESAIGVALLVPDHFDDLLESDAVRALSPDAKRRWLEGLDALRARLPRKGTWFRGEVELFGRWVMRLQETRGLGSWRQVVGRDGAGWRYGFDQRRAVADYVARVIALAPEFDEAYAHEPVETVRRLAEMHARHDADPNPVFDYAFPLLTAAPGREVGLAELDLLRLALAHDLGLERDAPQDPVGGVVEVEVTDEFVRVWTTLWESERTLEIVLAR